MHQPPNLRRLAALAAGLLVLAAAEAGAAPGSDSQLWSEFGLDARLSDRVELTGTVVDRQGDGLPNPTLWGGGLTADVHLAPHWTVGGGVYEIQTRSAPSGSRLNVTLPLAYVTATGSAAGFHVSDRNRVERLDGAPGDPWRYRNRLPIEHPLRLGPPLRSLFVSDEVFYDFSRARVSRNRAQAGVSLAPIGPATLQLYFMRQDDRFARIGGLDIIGLCLKVDVG